MSVHLHNPRPYLIGPEVFTTHLGEINSDGLEGGSFTDSDLRNRLDREQWAEYRQARCEGFHPVLVIDLDTGVSALEMRKQS